MIDCSIYNHDQWKMRMVIIIRRGMIDGIFHPMVTEGEYLSPRCFQDRTDRFRRADHIDSPCLWMNGVNSTGKKTSQHRTLFVHDSRKACLIVGQPAAIRDEIIVRR